MIIVLSSTFQGVPIRVLNGELFQLTGPSLGTPNWKVSTLDPPS